MAESIGIASGVITLTLFAFESSILLYQTVKSFQDNNRVVRELKQELEALSNVIKSLHQLASEDEDQFKVLCIPLLRCGKACEEFKELAVSFTKHSSQSKTSFRDWAKLKYMGNDIAGFKNMLSGYKSTISIAIGDINLRKTAVSANAIKEFKEQLENTTADLNEHFRDLNSKLKALSTQDSSTTEEAIAERERILEEMDSAKECLAVCARAAQNTNKVRMNVFEDISAAQSANQVILSTFGDLILAKRISADVGATQWLGNMSGATVQQLVRARGVELSSLKILKGVDERDGRSIKFEDQYGSGHKLSHR